MYVGILEFLGGLSGDEGAICGGEDEVVVERFICRRGESSRQTLWIIVGGVKINPASSKVVYVRADVAPIETLLFSIT